MIDDEKTLHGTVHSRRTEYYRKKIIAHEIKHYRLRDAIMYGISKTNAIHANTETNSFPLHPYDTDENNKLNKPTDDDAGTLHSCAADAPMTDGA